jgi:WhiB family redox-sensing transcriptional regulator
MTTTLSVTSPRWLDALCAQADPEAWHPELAGSADTTRHAKRICAQCPIQAECLTWALDTGQPHGIWGGTTPAERRTMRRERAHHA